LPYDSPTLTIAETDVFSRYVTDYWTEEERGEFAAWIANTTMLAMWYGVPAVAAKYDGRAKEQEKAAVFVSSTTTCLRAARSGYC